MKDRVLIEFGVFGSHGAHSRELRVLSPGFADSHAESDLLAFKQFQSLSILHYLHSGEPLRSLQVLLFLVTVSTVIILKGLI